MNDDGITIEFADTARLADGEYKVFYGLRRGKRVRILISVDHWAQFLRAHDRADGVEARADLARIASNAEPFQIDVDGVSEYKVEFKG